MSQTYVVVAGDTLTKIAQKFGKASWRVIYDAPENAEFRLRRPNPDRIYPGDRLVIPDEPGSVSPDPLDIIRVVGTDGVRQGITRISDPLENAWEHVVLNLSLVKMEIHKRSPGDVTWGVTDYWSGIRGQPDFETTLRTIRRGRPNCVITQAAFQFMPKVPGSKGFLFGRLVIDHKSARVTADDEVRPERAALSFFEAPGRFQVTAAPSGVPGSGCAHGLGSLIPVIVDGRPSANDDLWKKVSGYGATGWTVVGIHKAWNVLSLYCQRWEGAGRRTPDELRKAFVKAGYNDAVLLDGSDSILLDINGERIIDPGKIKKRINQTFLCFTVPTTTV